MNYYDEASKLQDNGFGEFDRCLHLIYLTDGNYWKAEKLLSRIIMKEAKHMD
jgi:hypothetical protein